MHDTPIQVHRSTAPDAPSTTSHHDVARARQAMLVSTGHVPAEQSASGRDYVMSEFKLADLGSNVFGFLDEDGGWGVRKINKDYKN